MKRLLAMAAAMMAAAAGAATFGDVEATATVVLGAGETNVQAMASARAVTNIAALAVAPVNAVATNALALASTALQPGATNGLLRAEADTLATVTARGATTTEAVTIGSRGVGAVGESSFAQGVENIASGTWSSAFGTLATASGLGAIARGASTTATGDYSIADGNGSISIGDASHAAGALSRTLHYGAYAWQGMVDGIEPEFPYDSHGPGTFNINPVGGLAGFWIGETTLDALLGERATWQAATNIAAAAVAGSGHAIAEKVVSGAVGTASAGNRYFWTSATNVVLSVNLTSGQVVNLAKLNNTATNSIAAIGQVGWEWTGGDVTNTIAAGKSMTFGFLIDAATGKTNAYATGVSK